MSRRSLTQTFTRLVPVSLFVQACSLGSSIVFASHLGATTRTDAYYLALSIPVLVYSVLLAGIRLGGIPTLTEISADGSQEALDVACSELLSATVVISAVLSIVVTAVMLVVLPLAAGGGVDLARDTRQFLLELAPYSVTGAMLGALGAILAVRDRFAAATAVISVESILKIVLLLLFSRELGVQALVTGALAGNVIAVGVLWSCVHRRGISLRFVRFRHSPAVRSITKLSAPLILSQAALQMNPLIDRTTAGTLGPGAITQLEMGIRLFTAPTSLLTGMLIAPLAASWAARLASDGWPTVTRGFSRGCRAIVCLLPPLIILGFALRHELVALIYSSQKYTPVDVRNTANVLGVLLLGLIAQILIVAVTSLFVVGKDTVFPLKVGLANCVLNAVLDIILRAPLGVAGIALSTTLTITFLVCVSIAAAGRRWGPLGLWPEMRSVLILGTVASIAAAVIGLSVNRLFEPASRWAALGALGTGAISVLAAQLFIMKLGRGWQRIGIDSPRAGLRRLCKLRPGTAT